MIYRIFLFYSRCCFSANERKRWFRSSFIRFWCFWKSCFCEWLNGYYSQISIYIYKETGIQALPPLPINAPKMGTVWIESDSQVLVQTLLNPSISHPMGALIKGDELKGLELTSLAGANLESMREVWKREVNRGRWGRKGKRARATGLIAYSFGSGIHPSLHLERPYSDWLGQEKRKRAAD